MHKPPSGSTATASPVSYHLHLTIPPTWVKEKIPYYLCENAPSDRLNWPPDRPTGSLTVGPWGNKCAIAHAHGLIGLLPTPSPAVSGSYYDANLKNAHVMFLPDLRQI
jgi:hypothetical protein